MRSIFAAAAALAVLAPAFAGPKPHIPLTATYDRAPEADAELRATIEALRAAVAARDFAAIDAALAPDYQTIECHLDPTRPCAPRERGKAEAKAFARLSPGQRIRADLCCRDIAPGKITRKMREDEMLGVIGAGLAQETIGVSALPAGAACLPAPALLDRAKAAGIAELADVEPQNLRVLSDDFAFRDRPAADGATIARLPRGQIVPLLTETERALPDGWNAIVLPSGATGYTDVAGLDELASPGVCFRKDATGRWRIAAVVELVP